MRDDRPSDGRCVVTSTRATAATAPMAVERIFRWMDIIVVMVMVYWMVESGKWKVGWILDFGSFCSLDLDLDNERSVSHWNCVRYR